MSNRIDPEETRRIELRAVVEGDLPVLFEYQRQPEATQMAAFPARDRDAFMAHWKKILSDESVVALAVVVDGAVAGHIGCWVQQGERLVGYWIGKEFWGKGIASQALAMFLRRFLSRPIHAHVARHNVASIRVLEKCGFSWSDEATAALRESDDGIEESVYALCE